MNKKEIDETRWSNYNYDAPISESMLEESLSILNSIHESKQDVVNWEERAEMARVAQQHGHLIQHDGDDDYYTDQPQDMDESQSQGHPSQRPGHSDNPYENELMGQLGSIMGELEGFDDKR